MTWKNEIKLVPRSLLGDVLCKIQSLVQREHHIQVHVEAALCLGEVGAVDLKTVAWIKTKNDPMKIQKALSFDMPKRSGRGVQSSDEHRWNILMLLTSCVFDADIVIVKAASACLRSICAHPQIISMSDRLKEADIWSFLVPFMSSKNGTVSEEVHFTSSSNSFGVTSMFSSLGASDIWSDTGFSNEQIAFLRESRDSPVLWDHFKNFLSNPALWLRMVTCFMLSKFPPEQITQLCIPLCSVSHIVCEKLLGLVILELLRNDPLQKNNADLSKSFNFIFDLVVQSNQSKVNMALVPPLLGALEFLRQSPRDRTLSQGTVMKGQARPAFTSWDSNFWLNIDYLLAAKAAVKCNAVFSALFFIELWKEKCPDATEEEQRSYLQLLKTIFSRIAEPDAMHGVNSMGVVHEFNANADLKADVETYFRGGDLNEALDAQCRFLSLSGTLGDTTLCQLLLALNYQPLLQGQLRELLRSAGPDVGKFTEMYFEAAWRQRQWSDTSLVTNHVSRLDCMDMNILHAVPVIRKIHVYLYDS